MKTKKARFSTGQVWKTRHQAGHLVLIMAVPGRGLADVCPLIPASVAGPCDVAIPGIPSAVVSLELLHTTTTAHLAELKWTGTASYWKPVRTQLRRYLRGWKVKGVGAEYKSMAQANWRYHDMVLGREIEPAQGPLLKKIYAKEEHHPMSSGMHG